MKPFQVAIYLALPKVLSGSLSVSKTRSRTIMGPSTKYVTLFLTNFDPLPLSHCVTHLGTPLKYVTHLESPIFCSTCIHAYVFTGVDRGVFCLEGFVRVVFVLPPSVIIHLLQQKAKHHFQF